MLLDWLHPSHRQADQPIDPGHFGTEEGILKDSAATLRRVYAMSLASVYPHYLEKAAKKGRTHAEVDEIIAWLTGYSRPEIEAELKKETNFVSFFNQAPQLNPARTLITGVICGVRVENIEDPIMREVRYLDKLIDELAKGKSMDKILRQQ